MTGRRYYLTALFAWQRYAPRRTRRFQKLPRDEHTASEKNADEEFIRNDSFSERTKQPCEETVDGAE
jgi:hypothetical protein